MENIEMPATTPPVTVTDAMRSEFEENGYVITDPIFSRETLDELRHAFEEHWRCRIDEVDPDDPIAVRNSRERPFLSNFNAMSPVGRRFLRSSPLTDLARQWIGPDVDVSNNQAVIKPPMKQWNNTFAWHQDHYTPRTARIIGISSASAIRGNPFKDGSQ